MATKKIRSEIGSTVFSLPYLVARDKGYFADEGLEVELVARAGGPSGGAARLIADHRAVNSFGSALPSFEAGDTAIYRACEWGQVRRSHDTHRGGRVVERRSSVGTQSIIVREDSPIEVPADLAGVPVGVNFHHGSHYMVLGLLEGFIPRDDIEVVHVEGPTNKVGYNRFVAVRDGLVEAAAVMEPWVTVAEKLGYRVIAEGHYYGLEIGGPELDADELEAVNRAVRRAVADLQRDPLAHVGYLIDDVPEDIVRLEPSDFRPGRLRYVDPAPYAPEAFDRTYDWMVSWDLIPDGAAFELLVDNRVHAAV